MEVGSMNEQAAGQVDSAGRRRGKKQLMQLPRPAFSHAQPSGPDRQRRTAHEYALPLALATVGLSLVTFCAEGAQAQSPIQQSAAKACAAMSGRSKPDGQALQLLVMLQSGMDPTDSVAFQLYREVLKECPKDLANYQQRIKASNPFPAGSLVKQNSVDLTPGVSTQSASSQDSSHASSSDPKTVKPLGQGVNKGNVDNMKGADYYYFWAGPGSIQMKMAFKEMGVLGNPFRQALGFDFYTEDGKLISHNSVVSEAKLERVTNSGDFGSRHKVKLAVVPQSAQIRLGGYYEIEITGAVKFDGSAAASANVKPEDTALIKQSGVELTKSSGTVLYEPGKALTVAETSKEIRLFLAADVLFDFDTATLRPDAVDALQKAAAMIREKNHGIVRIEGYTDSKGKAAYNLQLSQMRAHAVETWLVQNGGFRASTFGTQGFGAERPIASNTKPGGADDPAGRQRNRRVEIVIAKSQSAAR
jgi:outer membrane protein OmpA-like peptidoglycan-associated protein